MQVKIDTKEKFHVITLTDQNLTAILAADLKETFTNYLNEEIKNVVLNLSNVETIEEEAASQLTRLQHLFYERHASFVICNVNPAIEQKLDELELLEVMNITPTESEAWDIVQMEEIERELLDDAEGEFPLKND